MSIKNFFKLLITLLLWQNFTFASDQKSTCPKMVTDLLTKEDKLKPVKSDAPKLAPKSRRSITEVTLLKKTIGVDPHRYTVEEDRELIDWLYKSIAHEISEESLRKNLNTRRLSKKDIRKYKLELTDMSTGETKVGKAPYNDDVRLENPFFDSNDILLIGEHYLSLRGIKNSTVKEQREMALEVFEGIRDVLLNGTVIARHAPTIKSPPPAFLGASGEDSFDYSWPSRSLYGDKKVVTEVTTKGIQMIRLIKEVNESVEQLIKEGKLVDEEAIEARRIAKGGFRFLMGFATHEGTHGLDYTVLGPRNLNHPDFKHLFDRKGYYKNFGYDFKLAGANPGRIGNISEYFKQAKEQSIDDYGVLSKLVLSKENSSQRKSALISFQDHFSDYKPKASEVEKFKTMSSEELWQYISMNFISKQRSLFWDSMLKYFVIEVNGFGINRLLLKGHGHSVFDYADFIQLLRTDKHADNLDFYPRDVTRLESYKKKPNHTVSKLVRELKEDYSDEFTPNGLFSLLRQSPEVKGDAVGYYYYWDAYMSWQGFNLEPPVETMLLGHAVPGLINHRLKEAINHGEKLGEDELIFIKDWKARVFDDEAKFSRLKSSYVNVPLDSIKATFLKLWGKVNELDLI